MELPWGGGGVSVEMSGNNQNIPANQALLKLLKKLSEISLFSCKI